MDKKKKITDINQIAFSVVSEATKDEKKETTEGKPEKNPAAVALGRLGGLKGGKARAESLSAKKRKTIAQKAAKARWSKKKKT